MEFDKLKDILGSVGKIDVPDMRTVLPDTSMFDPNRKEYHSPEEILEEDKDDLKFITAGCI